MNFKIHDQFKMDVINPLSSASVCVCVCVCVHLVAQGTKFCTTAADIFSVISVVLFLTQKNMYQFLHTEQKVPDTKSVSQVTPYYGTRFISPFWILEFGGGLLIYSPPWMAWYRVYKLSHTMSYQ